MSGTKLHRVKHARCQFNDYELSELLTGEAPLLAGEGFYDPDSPGERIAEKRNVTVMGSIWSQNGDMLLELWRSGWRPSHKFTGWEEPSGPRPPFPPGWKKFAQRW
jgi:hypothetical protein